MRKNNLYIDVHVIQTLPPSCVNRGDTGSPKTAIYGGSVRARVSSQCWKHAMRKFFMENYPEWDLGKRSKLIPGLIADAIKKQDAGISDEDAMLMAKEMILAASIEKAKEAGSEKAGKKAKNSSADSEETAKVGALFFISPAQIEKLAEIALKYKVLESEDGADKAKLKAEMKKDAELAVKENPTIDMALFGRMAASNPLLSYDAASQVAHAISTHEVSNEFDFFAAIDECLPEGEAGAAHIDTAEFNSSTMYRYANINVKHLSKSLKKDTAKAVRDFVEAFVCSMPTGKQNPFANKTLPDAVYVTIRTDSPVNMSGAFEKAVTTDGDGYINKSIQTFVDYTANCYEDFGYPEVILANNRFKEYDKIEAMSLLNLLSRVEAEINERLSDEVI